MITVARPRCGGSGQAGALQVSPPIPEIESPPAAVREALEAVRRQPASVERRHALADSLRATARHREAMVAYRAVIAMDPSRGMAHRDLGNVLTDSGNLDQGADVLRRAVELMPNEPGALLGLIRTLQKNGRPEEAMPFVERLKQAAAAAPADARRALYAGLALSQVNRLEEAILGVRRSLALAEHDAEAWDFLGLLLVDHRDWDDARAAFDRSLALAPDRPQTLFNRAALRLRMGDYQGGFADYEGRWESPLFTTPRQEYGVERWHGEPLHGKSLLIHTEQGLGDTLQFARFISHAKTAGAGRVVLECEDSMVRLLAGVAGIDEIVRRGQVIPTTDLHAPLMSLAHFAGAMLATVSQNVPYLGIAHVRRYLPARRFGVRLRIGIVWEASRSGGSFRAKSLPLEEFAPLAARADVELISLQKGPAEQSLAVSPLGARIADLGSRFVDLRDTAEVLAQLDLVITVDTAVCHLAGAMGVPVWTLVPHNCDWRWLLDRTDSPWYPSMRLFRQTPSGGWASAMQQIIAAIDTATPAVTSCHERFAPHARVPSGSLLVVALKHAEQGEFLLAAHAYNDALVIDGSDADVWNNFGVALAKCDRLSESRDAFRRSVSITPGNGEASRNLVAVEQALHGVPRSQPQGDPHRPRFALDWQVGATSGWGIYGMNLVVHALRRGEFTPILFRDPQLEGTTPPQRAALERLATGRAQAEQALQRDGACPFPTLHALGNGLQAGPLSVQLRSTRRLGMVFFEDTRFRLDTIDRGRSYDRLVAGSTWNTEVLKANGLDQTVMVIQGIDTSVFHPAPRSGKLSSRFVVFSGGKLEYRKGQDLVVAAFSRFRQRHPDALLMVAWHNHWPQTIAEIVTAGHVTDVPAMTHGKLDVVPWLVRHGIPADAVLDLGLVPNEQMASLIREADVAVFPNRAEGGTNLVAMEALASGVPCIIAANTGHLDLTSDEHNLVLHRQDLCRPTPCFSGTDGWGESSVDEIVEALEFAYVQREEVHRRATRAAAVMAGASWHNQIDRLFDVVGDLLT